MNVDELIATAQPRTQQVRICARGDLVADHAEAVAAYERALAEDDSLTGNETSRAAAQRVSDIEAEQEDSTITFTVTSISRRVWADLLAKNPPSKEERRAGHDHDPVNFPVAVVAACVIEPEKLTEDQARLLNEVLPAGEWGKLWVAALTLNITATPAPKLQAATELLQVNGPSSTTSGREESPGAGSLAGSGKQ